MQTLGSTLHAPLTSLMVMALGVVGQISMHGRVLQLRQNMAMSMPGYTL